MYIRSLEAIREDLSEAKRKKSWKDIGQIIETINKIVMVYSASSTEEAGVPMLNPTNQNSNDVVKSIYATKKEFLNKNDELTKKTFEPMLSKSLEESSKLFKNIKIRVNHKQNEIGRSIRGCKGK